MARKMLLACVSLLMIAVCAATNREPDLIPQNEKSPLDHLGPIRAGK